ncbi:MAG: cytidylate kinase-like family protein [Clostridiales bacterium]|nr:cytidylate kinase-like family protein [Clostridiales bacterium]
MMNYYININRQFGSLGRPIAQKLAEILGIEYYDRDIVEAVAKQTNLHVSKVDDHDEQTISRFARMAQPLGSDSVDMQDKLFTTQQKIIRDFAKKGSAIFVGRCADLILRDKNCLNVYIYAPKEQRYLNCVNSLGMNPSEARKMIEKVDKARNRYWLRYAKHLPSDLEYCHLMIDSSLFGINGTAQMLATVVKDRFQEIEES